MHTRETLTLLFAMFFATPALANVYKWTDTNGNVSYASTPAPKSVKVRSSHKITLYKTPKSSLRRQSRYKPLINRNTTSYKRHKIKTVSLQDRAHHQCQKAIEKLPRVIAATNKLLAMGRASGKLSDADYHQKREKLRDLRIKPNTYSECIDNYKNNYAERGQINTFANNNPEMILTIVILERFFMEMEKALRE